MSKSEDFEYSWSLGDDYDCETCGYTWNTLRLEWFDDNLWCFSMSVGCYGGESVMSDDENFVKMADNVITDCLRYENFSEADADYARKLIRELVESNG